MVIIEISNHKAYKDRSVSNDHHRTVNNITLNIDRVRIPGTYDKNLFSSSLKRELGEIIAQNQQHLTKMKSKDVDRVVDNSSRESFDSKAMGKYLARVIYNELGIN